MRASLPLCFSMVVGLVGVAVASEPVAQVDQYVEEQMKAHHIPGVCVGVAKDGRTLLAKGYGLANVELRVPATADSAFELLSVGKQFTAAAAMLLCEDGKIGLDDKVSQYLEGLPPAWASVTVRQCLSHTSGVADYTDVAGFWDRIRDDATPASLVDSVRHVPLGFEPGMRWQYSNTNYFLVALVIEKVSGGSFDQFLQTRVFQPLEMSATRMNALTDIIPNRADGYQWIGNEARRMPVALTGYHGRVDVLQNAVSVSPTKKWAAGAVLSTVNDLLKWDAALSTGRLLKPDSALEMLRNARLNDGTQVDYGLGNELSDRKGHRVAGHQGGGVAFNCALYRLVDDRLTIIVLCNQSSAPSRAMAARIAEFYLPDLATQEPPIEDKEPEVTAMFKSLLVGAAVGQVDADRFSAASQKTAEFVQRVGPGFLGRRGSLSGVTLIGRKASEGRRVYRYRADFEKGALRWTVCLDNDGKIVSLEPDPE